MKGGLLAVEGVAQPREEATARRRARHGDLRLLLAPKPCELAQQLFLLVIEVAGRLDVEVDIEITPTDAAGQVRHAVRTQREHRAGLRPGLDLERLGAVERLDVDGGAERGGRHRQRHVAVQVVAVAGEDRVLPLADLDIEVARRATTRAYLALAGQPQPHAVVDAGRNLDRDGAACAHPPLARTVGAWVPDLRADAAALRAGARSDQLTEER